MKFFSLLVSFFMLITPAQRFVCDGELISATIRNNFNGDFSLVNDLENVDPGAFVVLDWKNLSLMLPVSFQKGETSFTDRRWLWSYQDNEKGLHEDNPRFAQRMPDGKTIEHDCKVTIEERIG